MDINADVIKRAWTDPSYREGLPEEVRSALPDPPEGAAGMSAEELESAAGGSIVDTIFHEPVDPLAGPPPFISDL